jgi:tetratricopeptide repeat protein
MLRCPQMTKDQIQFLASGILFGFLVGFLIAYGVYEPRVVGQAAPVPEAGNMGMAGGGGAPAGTAAQGASGAAAPGSGNEQVMGRVFEEITALKAAIAKDPKDLRALTRLANMYHDAGKYDQAIEYYRQALAIDPKNVDSRTDMGICLRELGKSDDAIAQFRTSLSYDSRHWQTWLNLGVVTLFDKNDVQGASEAFDKVESLNPGFKDLPLLKEALKKARASTGRERS